MTKDNCYPDGLSPEEQTEIADAVLFLNNLRNNPKPFPLTPKQRAIQKNRPWEVSAIVRSRPYKDLVNSYKEMLFENFPEERPSP